MNNPVVIEARVENETTRELKKMALEMVSKIEKVKADRKNLSEMLESALLNVEEYRDAKEQTDDAKEELSKAKTAIMSQKANQDLTEKYKELGHDLKEAKEALSDYLSEYQRMTGVTELDTLDGRKLRIVKKYSVSIGQMRMF